LINGASVEQVIEATCPLGCSDCNGEINTYFILTSNSENKLSIHTRSNLVNFQPDCDRSWGAPNGFKGGGRPNSEVAYLHFVPCLGCNNLKSICVIQINKNELSRLVPGEFKKVCVIFLWQLLAEVQLIKIHKKTSKSRICELYHN